MKWNSTETDEKADYSFPRLEIPEIPEAWYANVEASIICMSGGYLSPRW